MTVKYLVIIFFNLGSNIDIEIAEYCSLLSKDQEYMYETNKAKGFYALGCQCLNNGKYSLDLVGKDKDKCSHSTMTGDKELISHIIKLSSKINLPTTFEEYPESVRKAFETYEKKDYLGICNEMLFTN